MGALRDAHPMWPHQRGRHIGAAAGIIKGGAEAKMSTPESSARKSFFTRRRVIAGAVALIMALAVAGFGFGVFEGGASNAVKITVVRFETYSSLGGPVAVITVSNASPTRVVGVLCGTNDLRERPL